MMMMMMMLLSSLFRLQGTVAAANWLIGVRYLRNILNPKARARLLHESTRSTLPYFTLNILYTLPYLTYFIVLSILTSVCPLKVTRKNRCNL